MEGPGGEETGWISAPEGEPTPSVVSSASSINYDARKWNLIDNAAQIKDVNSVAHRSYDGIIYID